MTKTVITTALTLGLGFLSTPSFAGSYIVNDRAITASWRLQMWSNWKIT